VKGLAPVVVREKAAVPEGQVETGAGYGDTTGFGVVFRSTETLLVLEFAAAKSGLPSALKSPTATEYGSVPTV